MMKKPVIEQILLSFAFVTSFAAITACSSKSEWLTNPPPTAASYRENGGVMKEEFISNAEFVIVVDNSGSMKPKIERVNRELGTFVSTFTNKNPLRYRFGVLEITDEHSVGFDFKFPGQLRQVRESEDQLIPNKFFISSDDDLSQDRRIKLMQATIQVPIKQPHSERGPNFEAMFRPLFDLYSDKGRVHPNNQGFFMADDAYTFFMIISDANDESVNLTPLNVALQLSRTKKDYVPGRVSKYVSGFAAMVPVHRGENCNQDQAGPPTRTQELIRLVGGVSVDVCAQDFGAAMAKWGQQIRKKTIERDIILKAEPTITNSNDPNDEKELRVFYGPDSQDMSKNKFIPRNMNGKKGGYTFDPRGHQWSLHFGEDFELENAQPHSTLHILYVGVNAQARGQGKVRPLAGPRAKRSEQIPLPPPPPPPPPLQKD